MTGTEGVTFLKGKGGVSGVSTNSFFRVDCLSHCCLQVRDSVGIDNKK